MSHYTETPVGVKVNVFLKGLEFKGLVIYFGFVPWMVSLNVPKQCIPLNLVYMSKYQLDIEIQLFLWLALLLY